MHLSSKPRVLSSGASRFVEWSGSKIAGHHQRLFLGITAILSQPFIDYFNPLVDKDTRKHSTIRTVVKIIVGTAVGVAVRKLCIVASKPLLEKGIIKPLTKGVLENNEKLQQYANQLGTFMGVIVSLFTNFAIDMPFTKMGYDWLRKKFDTNNKPSKPSGGNYA
jgi:hypothetical protein